MRGFMMMAVLVCVGAAWAEEPEKELVEEKGYNAWHFRIGPVMAPRVRTSIRGPQLLLPRLPRNGSMTEGTYGTAPAGREAGYVKRDYLDGRVYPDVGTTDPDTMVYGLTWDWGASDVPSQYSGGRMAFHSDAGRWTESYSSSSSAEGFGSECNRDVLFGVEAMGGWTFWDNHTFDAAADFGFRYYGSGDLSTHTKGAASVTTMRDVYRIVDTYDASGWSTVPRGPHDGTPGGPGRLLGALPERGEELADSSQSSSTYSYFSNSKLDYHIWDLRLGPTLGWQATDWFSLRGGTYGLIGLVDARLKTDVASVAGSYHAVSEKCTPVFGMAFALNAQANLTDWMFLYGGIEYDWWTDNVAMDAGGSHATLQLSDFSVSAGIGFEF